MRTAHELQPDAELIDLFDRFLALVGDATRRFGGLFPYHHLCRRLQGILARSAACVVVTDDDGRPLTTLTVTWRDGAFRRVEPTANVALRWSVPRHRLEHAATHPWTYLADPRRLGFAWFDEPGSPSPWARPATVRPLDSVRASPLSS